MYITKHGRIIAGWNLKASLPAILSCLAAFPLATIKQGNKKNVVANSAQHVVWPEGFVTWTVGLPVAANFLIIIFSSRSSGNTCTWPRRAGGYLVQGCCSLQVLSTPTFKPSVCIQTRILYSFAILLTMTVYPGANNLEGFFNVMYTFFKKGYMLIC